MAKNIDFISMSLLPLSWLLVYVLIIIKENVTGVCLFIVPGWILGGNNHCFLADSFMKKPICNSQFFNLLDVSKN